jgi:hypothetical protein
MHGPCPHALLAALFLELLFTGTLNAQQWPIEAVYAAKDKIVVPIGKQATAHSLDLPAFQHRDGKRVCLRLKAYLDYPKPAGWNPYLAITINGRTLGPLLATGENRLINRGQFCETKVDRHDWWGQSLGDHALLTFVGPGDVLDDRVIQPRDEPYWYVLDISDEVHFVEIGADGRMESARPNRIDLSNTCLKKYLGAGAKLDHMTIKGLCVGYLSEDLVKRHQKASLIQYQGEKEKARIAADGFAAIVTESAGIRIDMKGDRYFIASSFSCPGPTIGCNRFDPDMLAGENGWKPCIRKVDEKTIRIEGQSQHYQVVRTLSLHKGKLRVADQFTNKTASPIGVRICNSLAISGFPRPGTYFLGGRENQYAPVTGTAENPTAFVAQGYSSLGIVAEDNVHRLQLVLSRRTNVFDLTVGHFGLDGHKAYKFEWTIYPRPHRDYWAFINEVRRDWKVNFTVLGPFAFDKLEKKRKTRIINIGPWIDYNTGAGITREQYRAQWGPRVTKLRKDDPKLIVLGKLENNLVAVDKRAVDGGQVLPVSEGHRGGKYGLTLTKEQTAILESNPYAGSVLRTADGRMLVDTYYAKEPFINLMLYLVEGNYRYKMYFEQIDFLMDQVGCNGIYIDQFSMGWVAMERWDRRTMDKWDGHTVDIDEKTGQLVRRYTDCGLVGATARAEVLKYILRKGGKVVVNSFPCVRETQSLPAFRFAEMENDDFDPLTFLKGKPPTCRYQVKGHLASPIILGLRPVRWGKRGEEHWAELITKAVITALRNGVLYYYYTCYIPDKGPGAGDYGPVNHMFPFTPMELHSGWLVGQERTIACISGTYRWPNKEAPACHRFDLKGREVPHGFKMQRQGDGWQVKVVVDDWNEVAVLEEPTVGR